MIFTIDSCVPMALKNIDTCHDLDSISELFQAALVGRIKLQLTSAFERDRLRTGGVPSRILRNSELLEWVLEQPVVPTRAGGVFRLGVSGLDNEDLLCDEESKILAENLKVILFKKNRKPDDLGRLYSDIDHLLAHHIAKNDAFITLDNDTIYKFRDQLASFGIKVLTPVEAVRTSN